MWLLILGIAVLDAIEAAVQRRILGFRPVVALVPALAALSTAVAPYLLDAFAAYRAEQTFSPGPGIPRPMLALYIAGLHALCLAAGAALLPFARPRGAARWAVRAACKAPGRSASSESKKTINSLSAAASPLLRAPETPKSSWWMTVTRSSFAAQASQSAPLSSGLPSSTKMQVSPPSTC